MVPLSHRVVSGQCARSVATRTDNPPIPRHIKAAWCSPPRCRKCTQPFDAGMRLDWIKPQDAVQTFE